MKRLFSAMIIGIGLGCATLAQAAAPQPDPASFAIRLEAGDIDQARAWLDGGLNPNFAGSRIGTGLMIGAWEGNIELMRLFLSRGADINRVNANGETALALAAWKGNAAAVRWLLERGARLNMGGKQWSALHYAVFSGRRELAQELIGLGADINARSPNGSSVLMMAVYEGNEELARSLIEKGADPRVKNDWGDGALEWAMRFNQVKIARLVTDAQQFAQAMNEPKETWGEPRRSLPTSKELEDLLRIRETLLSRKMSVAAIDDKIAAERARIARVQLNREALPPRAATLEITAARQTPRDQKATLVYDRDGKPSGYAVPATTYTGTPRMPAKAPLKNY